MQSNVFALEIVFKVIKSYSCSHFWFNRQFITASKESHRGIYVEQGFIIEAVHWIILFDKNLERQFI